ncbi:MAG: response regulator [Flavobacteriaceae bacterium]|nr:response regulator [Flavobacteriaceae bacterium]
MSPHNYKETFFNKKIQLITINSEGSVLSSENNLFHVDKGSFIQNVHPFFESLVLLLPTVKNSMNFPCIELTVDGKRFQVDIEIMNQKDSFLIVIFDFTSHYMECNTLVQEKNESIIKRYRLIFEREILKEKEAFKNAFLANLSHELRNPLSNMLGFVDLLKETKLSYEHLEILRVIRNTGFHLEALLNDLLDISKIEQGKLSLKQIPFKLNDIIKHLEEVYSRKAQKRKITFSTTTDANIPKTIIGDPIRLTQILTNIIDNAFKYTDNGTISLGISQNLNRARKVSLSFVISDTGIGIKKENIPLVFDEYYQINPNNKKIIGAGLGLKIVHTLVTLQEGKVFIESEEGQGTTVKIKLPYKIPVVEVVKQKKPEQHLKNGDNQVINILLVDDSEINQMLLMKLFISKGGYYIDLATNGKDAIDIASSRSYDLMLLDLDMPVMDGFETLKKIRSSKSEELMNTPVIVLSGKASEEDRKKALKLGARGYLTKPFDKNELFNLTQSVVNK